MIESVSSAYSDTSLERTNNSYINNHNLNIFSFSLYRHIPSSGFLVRYFSGYLLKTPLSTWGEYIEDVRNLKNESDVNYFLK
jgi:hypothetical protein